MFPVKFSQEQIGEFKAFLDLKWSAFMIIRHFKKKNVFVSKSYLYYLKSSSEKSSDLFSGSKVERKVGGRPSKLNSTQLKKLDMVTKSADPPVLKQLSKEFKVSEGAIRYNLKHKLGKKLVKKPKAHYNSANSNNTKTIPSFLVAVFAPKKQKMENFVTSDEAWFYLSNNNGKRNVQYISKGATRKSCEVFTTIRHKKGVMVWMAISARRVFKPIFVNMGAKINKKYYIARVLKPFFKEMLSVYPRYRVIFHQDSAPVHTANETQKFIRSQKITYVRPHQWLPNSPDAAPCDYWLWGYLKSQIKAWPKRLRQIYYNKGQHIEK